MIDFENEIYTIVRNAIKEEFPKAYVTPEYVRKPSSFPHVSFWESENTIHKASIDSGSVENNVYADYEVNVYSNKQNGKKIEAKEIMAVIDREMIRLGFVRSFAHEIPNVDDATIYRRLARYRGVISKDGKIATR